MLSILLGPLAVIVWPVLIVLVAILLHRQGYNWFLSVLGGIFTEIGAIALCITGAVNVLDGNPFLGAKR